MYHDDVGGIGGLVLAIFHKMETSKKMKKVRECGTCCGLLRRDTTEVCQNNYDDRVLRRGHLSSSLLVWPHEVDPP